MISGGFLSRFFKCSFHSWSLSSWLAAVSFALEALFCLLASFMVCYAHHDCLFSWSKLTGAAEYTDYILAFLWFILLSKDVFFMLSHLSLIVIDSQGTAHLALGLVGMHSAAISIWVVTKFLFVIRSMSFRCFLKRIKLVSYSYYIFIAYITVGKPGSVISLSFTCLFLISL